jgi:hypothetical protein
MDFWKALEDLNDERERLSKMISSLEELTGGKPRKRGRKSMSPAERKQVSERMRRYWAARKPGKSGR